MWSTISHYANVYVKKVILQFVEWAYTLVLEFFSTSKLSFYIHCAYAKFMLQYEEEESQT